MAFYIFGSIVSPWEKISPDAYPGGTHGEGLITLFNNILRTSIVIAGIWSFINFIIAGYGFMTAQGNPDKITNAWNKIWQTLIGLIIVVGSLIIAAIIGYLIYNDPTAIISPKIYGPGLSS